MSGFLQIAEIPTGIVPGILAVAPSDHYIAPLLISLLAAVVTAGLVIVCVVVRLIRVRCQTVHRHSDSSSGAVPRPALRGANIFGLPNAWYAVRCDQLIEVQSALDLHNPVPCSWDEGLAGLESHKIFISAPVRGWVLILGKELPNALEDPDECFHFLRNMSRRVGRLQFFSVNRAVGHHAWAEAREGKIVRAYAWAGETVWNQGRKTNAETRLGVVCCNYGETLEAGRFGQPSPVQMNLEKVPQLAARWSVDPAAIDEWSIRGATGIAGDLDPSTFRLP